jgi:hypothetical protein
MGAIAELASIVSAIARSVGTPGFPNLRRLSELANPKLSEVPPPPPDLVGPEQEVKNKKRFQHASRKQSGISGKSGGSSGRS